ncbi:MAG: hypothetical protein LBD70_01225 [Bifidobacteriaceae bacterium]|jgi:hypothetical protein|nr:hypothetical protein [Bifidobacteriaceae bacterium]
MRKDEGTAAVLGHLAALGLGLAGLVVATQLVGGALGAWLIAAVAGLAP